jgi:capsular polysaccharide biosynthesis protein
MWTGCCAEVIKGRHPPKLVVAEGCRNAGALRELLQEQRYESHSVKYGRFFECIVDPVGVCLLTREQQLIWETIRVYEYFDAGFSKLQHVGSRDGKYYARAGEFDRIDADVIIPFHASMAFGHFIFDGLPQILHFIDEIRDGRLKILLPDTRPGWCDKHLAHWGIDASHCIVAPAQRSFVVKSAIVCSALTTLSAFYPNRQFMAGFTADAGNVSSAGDPTRRKVYLKRKSAANFSDREITNEEAVAAALEARGVHVADPSRMSMSDQVRMFREADLIVGAHGSAFANLAFCRPETKVIDLMPDDWIGYWNKRGITERWLARVSAMNNLDYCVLLCASNTSQSDLGGGASILYEVDIDRLLETIGLNTPAS